MIHLLKTRRYCAQVTLLLQGSNTMKLGLGKIEAASCIYEEEYETIGHPYNARVHPFKEQLRNTYEGTLTLNYLDIYFCLR